MPLTKPCKYVLSSISRTGVSHRLGPPQKIWIALTRPLEHNTAQSTCPFFANSPRITLAGREMCVSGPGCGIVHPSRCSSETTREGSCENTLGVRRSISASASSQVSANTDEANNTNDAAASVQTFVTSFAPNAKLTCEPRGAKRRRGESG
jgi:hypothetical protein